MDHSQPDKCFFHPVYRTFRFGKKNHPLGRAFTLFGKKAFFHPSEFYIVPYSNPDSFMSNESMFKKGTLRPLESNHSNKQNVLEYTFCLFSAIFKKKLIIAPLEIKPLTGFVSPASGLKLTHGAAGLTLLPFCFSNLSV